MCLNKAKCNVKMEFFQILFWQKRDVRSLWRSSATTITRPVSCVTYPRPPPPVPLQDAPCLHPRPCMHWFLDFSYCSFHGDSESNGWKISNFVFSFNNVFWHLGKFRTQYYSLGSCNKIRNLTDWKTAPTPVLFFFYGGLVFWWDYVLKETDFYPPAGRERDITHFYAASTARGKKY